MWVHAVHGSLSSRVSHVACDVARHTAGNIDVNMLLLTLVLPAACLFQSPRQETYDSMPKLTTSRSYGLGTAAPQNPALKAALPGYHVVPHTLPTASGRPQHWPMVRLQDERLRCPRPEAGLGQVLGSLPGAYQSQSQICEQKCQNDPVIFGFLRVGLRAQAVQGLQFKGLEDLRFST